MSMYASTGSVVDAGHRNTMGGALTYASSMTSGDIHMMGVDECKPPSVTEKLTGYQSHHLKLEPAWALGVVDADEPTRRSINIEPAPVSSSRRSLSFDASDSPSIINNRDYILDLASPNRPSAAPLDSSTRVQKHPATFQCNLCPKRFTRAYNLRSHLRTHSDERPFVCTVCGKAFARQHDRKRHEGLHSAEKKFVCRGELFSKAGQTWGCGRRFARADALGRHFRSEAGRTCIKPLLDEEEAERRRQTNEGGKQQLIVSPDLSAFNLPVALFTQYPALANIDWAAVEPKKTDIDPGELSDLSNKSDYAQHWGHPPANDTYMTEYNSEIHFDEDPTL
jgi:transcription factor CRZ1